MSNCKKCGREDGHWIGCEAAPASIPVTAGPPDAGIVREIASAILAEVGTDRMSELYGSLDDLIHDHYEPYQSMGADEKALWRTAVAEEFGGEGYGDPASAADTCTFEDCPEPRRSADKRVKYCETHSDPKNRK